MTKIIIRLLALFMLGAGWLIAADSSAVSDKGALWSILKDQLACLRAVAQHRQAVPPLGQPTIGGSNSSAQTVAYKPSGYAVEQVKPGLYEISLDIAVQEDADDAFYDRFAGIMQEVSNLLWEITAGQFYIGRIRLKDKCSDGRIIIKRGTKDWKIVDGPGASGTGAMCLSPHTTAWYVWASGRPHPVILAHELLHGLFKFKDEYACQCIMRGTQNANAPITALCDDKSHQESGKSCWKRLLERYPNTEPQISQINSRKQKDTPPAIKVTKEHLKEFDTAQEQLMNKALLLESVAVSLFEQSQYDKVIAACRQKLEVMPNDPAAYYNMACAYALMAKPNEAMAALAKAIDNGFDDYEWLAEDADLVSLREKPEFQRLLNHENTKDTRETK